jgi:hypothetical protein
MIFIPPCIGCNGRRMYLHTTKSPFNSLTIIIYTVQRDFQVTVMPSQQSHGDREGKEKREKYDYHIIILYQHQIFKNSSTKNIEMQSII